MLKVALAAMVRRVDASYLIEHVDILHASLCPHPLDLVVRLREMTLYSDSAPFR